MENTTPPGNTEHVQEGIWEERIKWIEMREYENALLMAFGDNK